MPEHIMYPNPILIGQRRIYYNSANSFLTFTTHSRHTPMHKGYLNFGDTIDFYIPLFLIFKSDIVSCE